eukprot:PhM_4_TR13812/c0_g1_i1/m.18954
MIHTHTSSSSSRVSGIIFVVVILICLSLVLDRAGRRAGSDVVALSSPKSDDTENTNQAPPNPRSSKKPSVVTSEDTMMNKKKKKYSPLTLDDADAALFSKCSECKEWVHMFEKSQLVLTPADVGITAEGAPFPTVPPSLRSEAPLEDKKTTLRRFLGAGLQRLRAQLRDLLAAKKEEEEKKTRLFALAQVGHAYKQFFDTATRFFARGEKHMRSVFLKDAYLWVHAHPTLSCSIRHRMGGNEDGTKFICDPSALSALRGSKGLFTQTAASSSVPMQLVGLGSNRETTWESENVALFGESNLNMTVFDCTVKNDFPMPPRMTLRTECIGSKAEAIKLPNGKTMTTLPFFATMQSLGFVDILKIDIEGFEHPLFESWLRGILTYEQSMATDGVSPAFGSHLLQVEVHRFF